MTGTLKFYDQSRGFGFIRSEQAGDVFFHIKDCRASEADLEPGLGVEFELGAGRKGIAAKDVTPLEVTHA